MSTEAAEEKLEALRKQRAALAEQAEQAEQGPIEQQIEAEQRALDDDKRFLEAQEKYGPKRVRIVRTAEGAVILKRPPGSAYKRYMDSEGATTDSALVFVKSALVYPSRDAFDALLEEQHGILPICTKHAAELAGFVFSEVQKK